MILNSLTFKTNSVDQSIHIKLLNEVAIIYYYKMTCEGKYKILQNDINYIFNKYDDLLMFCCILYGAEVGIQ